MAVRVLLVDDQPLARAALKMVVESAPDLELVDEAGTGDEAVRLAAKTVPDVVVMDIRMPGMNGIEAARHIIGSGPGTRVVMLTTFDEDEHVYAALRAGASGFLVKDMALPDILAAIRVVATDEALIAPSVTRRLIEEFARRPEPAPAGPARRVPPLSVLSERERQVLKLVADGLSNAEIGERLYISGTTVKTHVTRMLAKLDARDRVHSLGTGRFLRSHGCVADSGAKLGALGWRRSRVRCRSAGRVSGAELPRPSVHRLGRLARHFE